MGLGVTRGLFSSINIGLLSAQYTRLAYPKTARALAFQMLEKNVPVPGYKLVQKQARRQWTDEAKAIETLHDMGVPRTELYSPEEIRSPAQMEKVLKKRKLALPDELVKSVSSGTTLASEDDPRPAVLQLGDLRAAISKLQ